MTVPSIVLAERVMTMAESETLKMAQLARELKSKGYQVINLSLGEPDFDTPEPIKNAAIKALSEGFTKYTPVAGIPELRQAISEKFYSENGLDYAPDQIIVSCGAKQSIANVCQALLNPGDEVIIFTPYWVSYFSIVQLAGATPVLLDSHISHDFQPQADDLESKISSKTKLLIFSNPCNPTGTVFSEESLLSYARVLSKYPDILIISDEIYEHITFDRRHISFGTLPGMQKRTITVNGFSKSFAMTGWRLGYLGGPKQLIDACIKVQGQFTSGANAFAQKAGVYALKFGMEDVQKMRLAFHKRRDLVLNLLSEIPDVNTNVPGGAFYIFPNISLIYGRKYKQRVIQDAEDFCDFLMHEAHVATVAGSSFGAPDCFRISYAASESEIIEAIHRIKLAIAKLE